MILYEKFKQKKNDFEKLLFYQIDADNNLENHINLKNRNGGLQVTNNKLNLLGVVLFYGYWGKKLVKK